MKLVIFVLFTFFCIVINVSCRLDAKTSNFPTDDMQFLEQIAADVVEKARVLPGQQNNTSGGTLICPGGYYPAFWIRDYAMSLESEKITLEEQKHALLVTAAKQQDMDWKIEKTGGFVPRGAIADHINYDGSPIFYPGTYDYNNQGGGPWGVLPCLDDHYFFIHMAWYYVQKSGDPAILKTEIKGLPLIDRLDLAFAVPPTDPKTHLIYVTDENNGISFGFMDTVRQTGYLLFGSVLKYRAAGELAQMHSLLNNQAKAGKYKAIADAIKKNIPETFPMVQGLFRSSTGKSCQPCVWGSAFAVYVDAAEPAQAQLISDALCQSYQEGTLSYKGQVRHLRTTDDFNEQRSWDTPAIGEGSRNRYQHGAYWGTPVGWVCFAMAKTDESLALKLAQEYLQELQEGDFRKGQGFGSPWECMHPEGNYQQNPIYMTSVTCPLAAFKRLGW